MQKAEEFIPYNKAHIAGRELYYIAQAVARGELKGDGPFTSLCSTLIEKKFGINKALIVQSCTAALEMTALLLNMNEGDEVIMPSFTFTSTANAFALRGAKPVFVDIDPRTLNIEAATIEPAITKRTKAICVVHYAGVSCDMDPIMALAKKANIVVIEDAAHAIMAKYKNRWLGSIGELAAFSFHETKNFSCGEGGALLINDPQYKLRAEILREKGTNRTQFFRGEIDKYTWCDIGGSFLPSEIIAAFLYGQLEQADTLFHKRLNIWDYYYKHTEDLEKKGFLTRPTIPDYATHNAHLFYLLLDSNKTRDDLIAYLKQRNICAVFHYIPLHSSPAGKKLGATDKELPVTNSISSKLVRLPLYMDLKLNDQERIIRELNNFFKK